jgi:ABC-type phosphate transport system substrate-binding protein
LPDEVRLCWSTTARRLLGVAARASLERAGARLRVLTESDRGARGRLLRGDDDLALIAGAATEEERAQGVVSRVLGYHVLVAIVHERHPLRDLPRHQLQAVLDGAATRWTHVAAHLPGPIVVAGVLEDAFTDQATSQTLLQQRFPAGAKLLPTDDAVREFVAEHDDALGLCSLAAVARAPAGVRVLTIDAVAPTVAAYTSGRYPLASPLRVLAKDARRCAWLDDRIAAGALSPR